MLKENEPVGVITVYRKEVRPFTDKQILAGPEFRQSGRHRHREHPPAQRAARIPSAADCNLGGAGASSLVRPASWSPFFKPCWRTRRASARPSSERCFERRKAAIAWWPCTGRHRPTPQERRRNPVLRVGPTNPLARVAASKQLEHIADIRVEQAYLDRDPVFVVLADDAGARTLLTVPML